MPAIRNGSSIIKEDLQKRKEKPIKLNRRKTPATQANSSPSTINNLDAEQKKTAFRPADSPDRVATFGSITNILTQYVQFGAYEEGNPKVGPGGSMNGAWTKIFTNQEGGNMGVIKSKHTIPMSLILPAMYSSFGRTHCRCSRQRRKFIIVLEPVNLVLVLLHMKIGPSINIFGVKSCWVHSRGV